MNSKREAKTIDTGSISRGKKIFWTRFGLNMIDVTARVIETEKNIHGR